MGPVKFDIAFQETKKKWKKKEHEMWEYSKEGKGEKITT
jgi:hypothetical protein